MNTKNTLKTAALLAALAALFGLVGTVLGGSQGLVIALALALVMNGLAYWFSDRIALKMAGAQAVERGDAPTLVAMVEDLAGRANMPVPRVYMIQDPSPNAFATGRNAQHAAVAVTTGILELLDTRELRGVLAHEFAHIKHRDILISSVAATVAGSLTWLAQWFQFSAMFGSHNDDEEGPGLLGGLVLMIVAPLAATLLQLAISRSREYAADAAGAELVRDPLSLANALAKLERGIWLRPMEVNPASAPLYIAHPFNGRGMVSLFQTHPPMQQRIARLEAMNAQSSYGRRALGTR